MPMTYEGMIAEIRRLTEAVGTLVSTVETLQGKIEEQTKKLGSNAYEAIRNAVIGRPDFILCLGC